MLKPNFPPFIPPPFPKSWFLHSLKPTAKALKKGLLPPKRKQKLSSNNIHFRVRTCSCREDNFPKTCLFDRSSNFSLWSVRSWWCSCKAWLRKTVRPGNPPEFYKKKRLQRKKNGGLEEDFPNLRPLEVNFGFQSSVARFRQSHGITQKWHSTPPWKWTCPPKKGTTPKRNLHLPTTIFQGTFVGFRGEWIISISRFRLSEPESQIPLMDATRPAFCWISCKLGCGDTAIRR